MVHQTPNPERLNSETVTTIPQEEIAHIIAGAAALAADMRIAELSETLTVSPTAVKDLRTWAENQSKIFRRGMRKDLPAWQRRAYAYDQSDLDEAIRWALGRYNEINPDEAITSLTLSSSGREIDVSSITDYITFTAAWWPYTSSDPEYSPNWRDFAVWPGDILFLDTSNEPQSGDVVRVWYKKLRAINGLDGASTTTIDQDTQTLILSGAAGFSAQERVQEQPGTRVPRKLREWADARLREFERGLKALSGRLAVQHSGIARTAPLDRWDRGGDKW